MEAMIVRFYAYFCAVIVDNKRSMKPLNSLEILPFLPLLVILLVGVTGGILVWFRRRRAVSWPSTQGTILQAVARPVANSYLRHWVGEVTYDYVVDGESYSGSHQIRARTERRAESLIAGCKGRMVVVRYSPKNHEISVLLKSDQPGGQLGNDAS
jgi:Protein of unknown function (DUF3592)